MREKTNLFYMPSNKVVVVDESMISFKEKVNFRVYNPQKSTKFGIKLFFYPTAVMVIFMSHFGKQDLSYT